MDAFELTCTYCSQREANSISSPANAMIVWVWFKTSFARVRSAFAGVSCSAAAHMWM